MRVLCTADLHIGRSSTKIPPDADHADFSSSNAWQRIVDIAIDRNADVLLLAGDIVDRTNTRFEAIDSLEKGLRRLHTAGISCYAVTGNHDCDILPRIINSLGSSCISLLGNEGKWETAEDRRGLVICGKSYTKGDSSLLKGFNPPSKANIPVIALLHSSLEAGQDSYAPVNTSELTAYSDIIWIAGHIHQASTYNDNLYIPGSPQSLDPGETGSHGLLLLEFDRACLVNAENIPVSTIRYESIDVDISTISDELEIPGLIRQSVSALELDIRKENPLHKLLSLRISLTGRTTLHAASRNTAAELAKDGMLLWADNPGINVESLESQALPAIDLQTLSQAEDVTADLADIITSIESGNFSDQYPELLDICIARAEQLYKRSDFIPISRDTTAEKEDSIPDGGQLQEIIKAQAMAVISELILQREES